jgi:signal transduction histidine kinase/CheY-like chemotaxis protein
MAVLPILGMWYLIWAYVDPDVLSEQNTVLLLFIIVAISLFGFIILRGVIRALSDFRGHLKSIVEDRILDTPVASDDPAGTGPSESLEEIVYNLIRHNSRLSDMFADMEEMTWSKTRELTHVNLELQRQDRKHKDVENELRKSNMQLSEALTKLKELQQCIIRHERLSALGDLASGIAHDINNALMPAIGFAELILMDASIAEDKTTLLKMVRDILEGAREASHVVSRLKNFYRRDASLNFTEVSPEELLREVRELTRPRWEQANRAEGRRIEFFVDASAAPRFKADRILLRDALVHIVMNSIDAMPGGGRITLSASADNDHVLLKAVDNGSGMESYVRDHCLEPFFTTKGAEATGMGLAVTYGTVRRHSGTIEVESTPKHGSTVCIRIPIDNKGDLDLPRHESGTAPCIEPLKILVIDDEEKSRSTLELLLKQGGHTASAAPSGRAGIAMAENGDFDVIITDRAMPDISGDEVAAVLHAARPEVPVIMVTGFGEMMIDQREKPEGVARIISKPVNPLDLMWALQDVTHKAGNTAAQ